MVKSNPYLRLVLLFVLLAALSGFAQKVPLPRPAFMLDGADQIAAGNDSNLGVVVPDGVGNARTPLEIDDAFLQTAGVQAHFESSNKLSEQASLVLAQNRVISVPHFNNTFDFRGKNFSFTVVGADPKSAQTTIIPTQVIPISLYFEGYADAKGDPIALDAESNLPAFVNSPNFRDASYPSGNTQFGDAIQRAEFFHVMSPEWHTRLGNPEMLRPVNIEVPDGAATLYRMRSTGAIFAVVDEGFFISQLNTILQFEDLDVTGLPIALTSNVFLAPRADIRRCCVMGFHTSFEGGQRNNLDLIQTFVWASWLSPGMFSGTVADVTAISHEISEWFNDPFNTNIVPDWQFPNAPASCQNNLETGDPMSASPHAGYPVTIGNFTYHPQNETLLQWFQRKTPSDAIDRAYSFPDESLLSSPAQECAAR